jgi:hypothetical protein
MAAGWNEDSCMITLDPEHYTDYIIVSNFCTCCFHYMLCITYLSCYDVLYVHALLDHKDSAEYFKKPLEHYASMALIFGDSMATKKYAKGSNEPLGDAYLGTEAVEEQGHNVPTTPTNGNAIPSPVNNEQCPSSSATRPNKRAKTSNFEVDGLVRAFTSSSNRPSIATEKLAKRNMDLSNDLYDMMKTLPGFNSAHISFYYSYLVANPHIRRAFYNLPFDAKSGLGGGVHYCQVSKKLTSTIM